MSRDVPGLDGLLYAQAETAVPNLTMCDAFQAGQVLGYAIGTADMIVLAVVLFAGFVLARWLGDVFAESALGIRIRWSLRRQARELRRLRRLEEGNASASEQRGTSAAAPRGRPDGNHGDNNR